jgi:hypothetical protein
MLCCAQSKRVPYKVSQILELEKDLGALDQHVLAVTFTAGGGYDADAAGGWFHILCEGGFVCT